MAKVKHRVGIRGSVENIYQSLTSNKGLEGWWASSTSGKIKIDQNIDLTFSGLATLSCKYKKLESNKIIQMECISGPGPWQGSELLLNWIRRMIKYF